MKKKEYLALKAKLSARLERIKAILVRLNVLHDIGLCRAGSYLCERWNSLHTAHWEAERELERLESRWSRRNWTAQDWQQWEMVMDNVD